MKNVFADYKPQEFNKLCNTMLDLSKKKMPEDLTDEELAKEPFEYLCGDRGIMRRNGGLHHQRYTNLIFSAWKNFAPKFCNHPPEYLVKQLIEERRQLADACSKLFQYKQTKIDYQELILRVCQDGFFLPIGYGRHEWDKKRGMTVTKRFNPAHVFWDHTATDFASAKYVIEKHRISRIDFYYKYGDIAYKVPKCEDTESLPKAQDAQDETKEYSDLDEIEYFLLWTKHCGVRRVYPFLKSWPGDWDGWIHISKQDGLPGEPWPLQFDEEEWHLTPLVLSKVNGRVGGISTWKAGKGLYLQLQDLLGAMERKTEESAKKVIAYPKAMQSFIDMVRSASGTLTLVPYDTAKLQVPDPSKAIQLIEFPGPTESELQAVSDTQSRWQEVTGYNAVSGVNPTGVETAAEANKLADAASNRVADDQGAVERWVKLIGRKELACDLSMIPRRSSISVNRSKEGVFEGEFPDQNKKELTHGIPYQEAVLLEKGVDDVEAAQSMLDSREKAASNTILTGNTPEAAAQAAQGTPIAPEVQARLNRKISLTDKVEIVNPGVEQFIGEKLGQYWMEGLTPRQIDSWLMVEIQLGSSSVQGRLQKVNEAMMTGKMLLPEYKELQMWDEYSLVVNALIDASEIESLRDAKLDGKRVSASVQRIQQQQAEAAQAQATAQAAAESQPKPLDPNVAAKAESESTKSNNSVATEEMKLMGLDKKAHMEEARNRHRSESQLFMAQRNGGPNG